MNPQLAAGVLAIAVLLSLGGCQPAVVSNAERNRVAVAMVKVQANQDRSDRGLAARDAANLRQVIIEDHATK